MIALTTIVTETPWPWWAADLVVIGFVTVLAWKIGWFFIGLALTARSILFMIGLLSALNLGGLSHSWEPLAAFILFAVVDTYTLGLWRCHKPWRIH